MKKPATIRYRGALIVPVVVTRFEVRRLDGRKFKSFADLKSAKAFLDGAAAVAKSFEPDTNR